MGDNWAPVAEAIRTRIADLGITQKELSARSGVSEATIRQLKNNYGPRRRSRHTLEDLSKGLQWPAHYLDRVLNENTPSNPAEVGSSLEVEVAELRSLVVDLANRVDALEHRDRPR